MKIQAFLQQRVIGLMIILMIGAAAVYGQEFRGTISGSVSDPNGAAVAGATVVIRNKATNVASTVTTNSEGSYSVPFLRKGNDGKLYPADAEDLTTGILRFKSGVVGNYLIDMGGRGAGHWMRIIHGLGGSLNLPPDRTGKPIQLTQRRDGKDVPVATEDLLALVPDFHLDDTTAALFGGDRLTSYQLDWAIIDANLLAIEYDDFAQAILQDREPEVNGEDGLRSLALMYGFIEAERAGRMLSADELVSGAASAYQDEL